MINSKNILDNLQFGNLEEQAFKNISLSLGQEYDDASEALYADGSDEAEMQEEFGPNNMHYINVIDRATVLKQQIIDILTSHPSIILDKEAFRLASLSAGFLDVLIGHLVKKVEPK